MLPTVNQTVFRTREKNRTKPAKNLAVVMGTRTTLVTHHVCADPGLLFTIYVYSWESYNDTGTGNGTSVQDVQLATVVEG